MGMMKRYMLEMIGQGSSHEEQDAIEYALMQGWVKPCYTLALDVTLIQGQLATILEQFRRVARENTDNNPALQELVGAISDYK